MAYDADRGFKAPLRKIEQQQLFKPTKQELIGLVKANKADLWLENKKLKAALEEAAEIVAKNFCPANHDCPLEEMAFGNCEGDPECTQERAERCWMEHWMGYWRMNGGGNNAKGL